MGDGGFQILNRHGQNGSSLHIAAHADRHGSGHVLVGSVRGNPGYFTAVGRFAVQCLPYRDMFIIQEYVCQGSFPLQALFPVFVAILYFLVPVQPVDADRQFVQDRLLHIPIDQHIQIPLQRKFHGQQQGQEQVIGQFLLFYGTKGQDVADLPLHADGRAAGVPVMTFPYPHLRPEHQEGRIVFPGNADAGSAYIAFQNAHPLDIVKDPLEKGHGVILDHITLVVDQQHAQVISVKLLLVLFIQPVHILYDLSMGFLMLSDLFPGEVVDLGHGFMGQTHRPAALPGIRYPGMHVGIDDTVFHEFIVVCR